MENFVYSLVNKPQTEELVHSDDKRETLRKVLKLGEDDEKSEILLDFYENLTNFCLNLDFTLEKTSCSISILSQIMNSAISKSLPLQISEETFKVLLKKHSIQRPPFSIQVFSQSDIASLESFTETAFFAHYSLYLYGFTPHKDIIITTEKLTCGRFPYCLSLQEALEISPESIHELKKYLPRVLTPKEIKTDLSNKEIENIDEPELDPISAYLHNEVKAIKSLIEEKVKKQDEEIFAKIELIKK